MKKTLMMAMLAATIFSSCTKDNSPADEATTPKSIEFFMGVTKISTRSLETPVSGLTTLPATVLANISNLKIELLNSAENKIGELTPDAAQLTNIKAGAKITFKNVDTRAVKVRTSFNTVADGVSINTLQGAGKLETMQYAGVADIDKPATSDPKVDPDGNVIWEALVDMYPAMSRFEVDVIDNNITYKTKPADKTNLTETAFKAATTRFFQTEIDAAKATALSDLKVALTAAGKTIANDADAVYEFDLTYSYKYNGNAVGGIKAINEVYINNFVTTKGSANTILYANNGAGNWSDDALAGYQKTSTIGQHSNMWDNTVYNGTGNKTVNAFNLFPQTSSANDLTTIKNEMPHIILKLTLDNDGNNTDNITRWITIRAFSNKTGGALINKFDAGKAYSLTGANLDIDFIVETMVVRAKYDGEQGESSPNPKDEDPTNENPEPKDTDLRVALTIKDWETIEVNPEW